ncbi:unnamed protein product [Gongylonema pulchrum]|uniref:Uncharacterized protein n=1 Tax=Gongylonema pulchrum TaxID=637853 RepID=A0A183E2W5_9BILA|nr:unnamed protein product [Gongylonema pulchrum]
MVLGLPTLCPIISASTISWRRSLDALGSAAQCLAVGSRGRGTITVTVVGGGRRPDVALVLGDGDRIQERKKGADQKFEAKTADSSKEESKSAQLYKEK